MSSSDGIRGKQRSRSQERESRGKKRSRSRERESIEQKRSPSRGGESRTMSRAAKSNGAKPRFEGRKGGDGRGALAPHVRLTRSGQQKGALQFRWRAASAAQPAPKRRPQLSLADIKKLGKEWSSTVP